MRQNIVLIGMMGAAKPQSGANFRAGWVALFSDTERAAAMTIPEFSPATARNSFSLPTEVLGRVLAPWGGESFSDRGGGCGRKNWARIGAHGVSVWLDCDLETLWYLSGAAPDAAPVADRRSARHAGTAL